MKANGPVVSQTQHPFGDPHATQYHRREELLRELQRRDTREQIQLPPLGAISGEISVAAPARRGWTIFATILLVVAIAACLAVAMS